jgi:hypothetical protein
MPRQKRGSRILEKAQVRLSGVESIDTQLDVGAGITAPGFTYTISDLRNKINAYNTALATVDALQNQVIEAEQAVASYAERMLTGVATKYGKDSNEYEMAGGVRKRDRKRPSRRAITATDQHVD